MLNLENKIDHVWMFWVWAINAEKFKDGTLNLKNTPKLLTISVDLHDFIMHVDHFKWMMDSES